MSLHILPVRTAGAAENMAVDFLLLQRYPDPAAPRFRHYDWRRPAVTFGYSQKIEFVRANLPSSTETSEDTALGDVHFDLCRRATGGGIVDHRSDWTYALVIPRAHPLYDDPAPRSYRAVHEALAAVLTTLGQPVIVKTECESATDKTVGRVPSPDNPTCLPSTGPTICFQRAELYDVIHATSGAKIAGAAQKRNKHGLLFQGSIEKSVLGEINWDNFHNHFTTALAAMLGTTAQPTTWPDLNEDEVTGLIEQYSSTEWIEYR